MSNFDYDKIKDMEYDTSRGCYVGKDGSELKVTPYSNGSGYKYDYYNKSPYNNDPHNSTHVKSDLNGNWEKTDNDRDNGTQEHSSGTGCYLTSACMKHFQEVFNDNCEELKILRWFRDKFVSKEDVEHYYITAPIIVNSIDSLEDNSKVYTYIYDYIVKPCVAAIKSGDYDFAYNRYKSSVIVLEEEFTKTVLKKDPIKSLNIK